MPTPIEQLRSRTIYTTDGVTVNWDFSFTDGYLDATHVKAQTKTPAGAVTQVTVTPAMLIGKYQLKITPALAAGNELTIYRDTPKNAPLVDFTDESGFSEIALDTNARQAVMVAAEAIDTINTSDIGAAIEAAAAAAVSAEGAAASAASAAAAEAGIIANATAAATTATAAATAAAAGSAAQSAASASLSASSATASSTSASSAAASAQSAQTNADRAITAWASATSPAETLAAISKSVHSGAIVKAIIYDTSKDSDGGAWRKRCTHTSWYNETLGGTTWLGQAATAAAGWGLAGAVTGAYFQNTTDGKFYTLGASSPSVTETFRGNVREFPAVVAVVADSARVVIYDLTQVGTPMWMVFRQAVAFWTSFSMLMSGSYSSVVMANGLLCVGSTAVAASGCLYRVSFIADECIAVASSAYYLGRWGGGGIANRNTAVAGAYKDGSSTHSYGTLVANTVNDCAVTILPDAPTDPATGLPVPTIAVATAGGVSVIKHDGTVVNSSDVSAYFNIKIRESDKTVFFDRGNQDHRLVFARNIGALSASFSTSSTYYNSAGVFAAPLPVSTAGDAGRGMLPFGSSVVRGGGSFGIQHIRENIAAPLKSMIAGISTGFNSGWMTGDVRGAWLADTVAESITATELVTNGVAPASAAGWSLTGVSTTNTGAVTGGEFVLTKNDTASDPIYSQSITTVVGKAYQITITGRRSGSATTYATPLAGSYANITSTSNSTATLFFVATSTTTILQIGAGGGAVTGVAYISSISVMQADADRSVKANGLNIIGTLTKSAVASGAQLVAYSGFSASNYLEQPYSANLDFGTGDFCVMNWESLATTSDQVRRVSRGVTGSGLIFGSYSGGALTYQFGLLGGATVNSGIAQTLGWNLIAWVREAGTLKLYVNGVLAYSVANSTNVTDAGAILRIGTDTLTATPTWAGVNKLALVRISATAPSADQIAHIYRTELPLFQAGAQCTIAGTSAAVTALAYDDATDLVHVGTSWGRSAFKDLTRVESEATTVGALTSLSAQYGTVLTGGTSAKVYQPALLLRDEIRRKEEARRALGKVPVFFEYDAVTSQVAFVVPKGYTVKAVYSAGTLKRVGSTKDYTVVSDGFAETVTFAVAPGNGVWVSLMCVRV